MTVEAPNMNVAPLERAELTATQSLMLREALGGREIEVHIYSTLVRVPEMFEAWVALAKEFLAGDALPRRASEIAILRLATRTECEYEWVHHVGRARAAGVDEETLAAIREGSGDPHWDGFEAALVRAADEIVDDRQISATTWGVLSGTFDVDQLVAFTVMLGFYSGTMMSLRTFGTPLEWRYRQTACECS
ncbi:carboxymuconolactone decarboxylase family protein [Aeromicrobium sp. PE09-221]|uniref:carboxymuconolactone decarboxylase family protein n=1 Tax=Aeromicrobium sp. PE09-221 TaxID=1898043 RepID=UPI001120C197|nr:carboxymuconolactone decarboxylase family protein [Aeromicrobium sp. PE09-221]